MRIIFSDFARNRTAGVTMTSRVVGAGVGLVILLAGCSTPGVSPSPVDMTQTYEAAIRLAAVRTPESVVPLRAIGPEQSLVTVATFTEWGIPASPLKRYTWVSQPAQLREMCRGKPDKILAIQEILGLPPVATPTDPAHRWQVIIFSVARKALFRPCPSGTDVAAASCAIDSVGKLDAATTRFLLNQMWTSNRLGGNAGTTVAGHPFTGMGWSYNWDPASTSHVGVSEYVAKPGTRIREPKIATPDQFCDAI
jgi:hypothetical protein